MLVLLRQQQLLLLLVLSLALLCPLCTTDNKQLGAPAPSARLNTSLVVALSNSSVNLPCDITLPNNQERVTLILWYREDLGLPIYSLEVGEDGSLLSADVWSDETLLSGRAQFRPEAFPALLRLQEVGLGDAGSYRCRVDFTEAPTRNTLINLTVIVPPDSVVIFDESGSPRTTFVGPYEEAATINLICDAFGGVPFPRVTWSLDGRMLDDSWTVLPNGTVRNELSLPAVDRSFLHRHLTCAADNNNDPEGLLAARMPVKVTVSVDMNFPPVAVKIELETNGHDEGVLVAGRQTRIECRSAGSRPPAHITWFLDGNRIEGGRTEVDPFDGNSTLSTLAFRPRREDMDKELVCRATNPLIGDERATLEDRVTLKIDYAPRVSLALGASISPEGIHEGGDVYFDCKIDARPKPNRIQWNFDGSPLAQDSRAGILIANQSLVLQTINRSRSGGYTCTATNPVGKGSSQEIILNVKYAPVCSLSEPVVYGVGMGEMMDIFCDVVANPYTLEFAWSFNNSADFLDVPKSRVKIINGTRSKFTHTPTNNKEYGTFMCTATNEVGRQRVPCVFHIILAAAPDPVSNCTVINKSSETFHLACTPGFDGGMEQVFLVVVTDRATGRVLHNETTRKLDFFVQNLDGGSSYMTTVTPINKKGVGESTHVIVDTLRHPAVELTQAEGANSGDGSDTVTAGKVEGEENWDILTGTLVGTLGCLTILLVASLVMRFCVCPANRAAGAAAAAAAAAAAYGAKGTGPPGTPSQHFDDDRSSNSVPLGADMFGDPSMAPLAPNCGAGSGIIVGGRGPVVRKGILKNTGGSIDSIDSGLMDGLEFIPPPPMPDDLFPTGDNARPPRDSDPDLAASLVGGLRPPEPSSSSCSSSSSSRQQCPRVGSSTLPRRISRDGLLASSHRSVVPKPAVGAMGHLPEELSAVLTLKRGVHLQAALSRSGRSHNSNTTNTTMAATTTTTTTQHHPEQQRTPLLKRKRESIV